MMSTLRARWASLAWASLCAVLLAACGPGVGGSGTGGTLDPLPALGASAQGLCASDLAPLLDCGPGAVGAPTPGPGTGTVYFTDTIDGRRVLVRLEGNTIALDVPCAGLRFSGTWASIGGQAARFYGFTGPDTALMPATLEARITGNSLQLTLRDAAGLVLLGPVLVTRTPAAGTPGGCG